MKNIAKIDEAIERAKAGERISLEEAGNNATLFRACNPCYFIALVI